LANEASNHPDLFDVQIIKQLARLMSRHDLSEIDLDQGEQHLRLRRGNRIKNLTAPAPVVHPAPAAVVAPVPTKPPEPDKPARKLHEIKSPAVGTFYAQAKEGAPPYVTVGAKVTPTTIVCLIEAMKIYNEIMAECSGVITEIVVENKQPVEYGTVLFRVDPAG
jgi:acetyl-CoA carboxylase biotin carboxyl carrier protein